MKRVRTISLVAAMIALCAIAGFAGGNNEPSDDALLIEEYGFRVHLPNETWAFQKSDARDVKAQLQHSQDSLYIRLQSSENMKGQSDRKVIEHYQKYQKKFDRSLVFDKNVTTANVGGRTWYILNGKKDGLVFSRHFNFEKENVFLISYEAGTPELFQKYVGDRDRFLEQIEFGVAPVKRFADFGALEIEVVPSGNAKLDLEDINNLAGEIKDELPPGAFKEVRAGKSATTDNTLLLTLEVKFFKRGSRAKRYFIGFGAGKSALDGDLIFTDKETGKVVYSSQVSHETTGGIFGGASFEGVGDQVSSIVKRKR